MRDFDKFVPFLENKENYDIFVKMRKMMQIEENNIFLKIIANEVKRALWEPKRYPR